MSFTLKRLNCLLGHRSFLVPATTEFALSAIDALTEEGILGVSLGQVSSLLPPQMDGSKDIAWPTIHQNSQFSMLNVNLGAMVLLEAWKTKLGANQQTALPYQVIFFGDKVSTLMFGRMGHLARVSRII